MSGYDQARIVDVGWLAGQRARPGLQVLDVRPPAAFVRGHLPGALNVAGGMLRPGPYDGGDLGELARRGAAALAQAGIDDDGTVVVYEGGPGLLATYVVWLLGFIGHPDVRLLEGGLTAWAAAGQPLDIGATTATPGRLTARPNTAMLATTDWLAQHLRDPEIRVVDARSPAEHQGIDQQAARAGAIPGAINVEWSAALAPDGSYRPAEELRAGLTAAGVAPEHEVVVYCQSGVRSAHLTTTLRALGYARVRNYVGSWAEWASRPDLPIVNQRA